MTSTDLTRELRLLQADFLEELGQEEEASRVRSRVQSDSAHSSARFSPESSEDEIADVALLALEAEYRRIEKEMRELRSGGREVRARLKEEIMRTRRHGQPSEEDLRAAVQRVVDQDDIVASRRGDRR
ncbi:hypothetical protein [Paramicrobacterium humi]|uniref:hypothetical protein n=1 Tax=Paramicrobacterium humi TaxID=640635 RepID=UPI000B8755DC|nr:hypothetical protein [Microbacterium humi]